MTWWDRVSRWFATGPVYHEPASKEIDESERAGVDEEQRQMRARLWALERDAEIQGRRWGH